MIRSTAGIVMFLLLFAIQTSFIHSLPGFLALAPLFFAISIYVIQHHTLTFGALWLVLYGFCLDIMDIGSVPLETISFAVAATIALTTSRRVFSNRSIYGVLGCGVLALAGLKAAQAGMLFFGSLRSASDVHWTVFFREVLWEAVALIVLLIILFQFARTIRTILVHTFLLSHKQETL